MLKYTLILMLSVLAFSCSTEEEEVKKPIETEELVEVKDGIYTEWYPGKKQVKYKGGQDEQNRRHGKWSFYSENGLELSITMFNSGLKDGFTIVKYPNGAIHYRGEYRNDEMVGVWTTYDEKGNVATEKDYGYPEE
jgi:antitoxin component YwqK of YwqJK toxin-antitoxin module